MMLCSTTCLPRSNTSGLGGCAHWQLPPRPAWRALPDTPTVADFIPEFETSAWGGIGAPKGTPTEIINKLNREINAGLADLKLKTRFADLGAIVLALSPIEYGKRIAEETDKWAKVIKFSGAKAN